MDSDSLDAKWDKWVAALSDSSVKAQSLLEAGKTEEAAKEFTTNGNPNVKSMFAEVEKKYPTRFAKIDKTGNWCDWARNLVMISRDADRALVAKNTNEAKTKLTGLREHFADLHAKTDTAKSNDAIWAFYKETQKEQPDSAKLTALEDAVKKASPSVKAKAESGAYSKAKAEWTAKVDGILKDGKVEKTEVEQLRQTTDVFCKSYGMQLE